MNRTENFIDGSEGAVYLIKQEIHGTRAWNFSEKQVRMHQANQNELHRAIRGQHERINNGTSMCRRTMMANMGREATYSGRELSPDEGANHPMDLRPDT